MSITTIVEVRVPRQEHLTPVYLETWSLKKLGDRLRHLAEAGTKVLLVADETVGGLYGERAGISLSDQGFDVIPFEAPLGEAAKTLETAQALHRVAQENHLGRNDIMLALGGGAVGDLTGFCASTYMRGCGFVQVPTTLLAQVDAGIGGKTAVNSGSGKNAIGTFYQPDMVIIDPEVLCSLPERDFRAGLGEVLKYALIEESITGKTGLLDFLEAHGASLWPVHPMSPVLHQIIDRCCRMKATVVEADEQDLTGQRALLNLGHTFAHAYEAITDYKLFRHGEAVALGLAHACYLSEHLGLLPQKQWERFEAVADVLKLKIYPPPDIDAQKLLALMKQDKKAHQGQIRFVLPVEQLGRVALKDNVSQEQILATL